MQPEVLQILELYNALKQFLNVTETFFFSSLMTGSESAGVLNEWPAWQVGTQSFLAFVSPRKEAYLMMEPCICQNELIKSHTDS